MSDLRKYPKTLAFHAIVRRVRERHDYAGSDDDGNAIFAHTSPYPTLSFSATVKAHGANFGLAFKNGKFLHAQSRNNVLSRVSKNTYNFIGFIEAMPPEVMQTLEEASSGKEITFYGEFCGKGIQSGAGVSRLPCMFMLFGAREATKGGTVHVALPRMPADVLRKGRIYTADQFGLAYTPIDFNDTTAAISHMTELTDAISQHCPISAAFGVDGGGEGAVWKHIVDGIVLFTFKTKGEKHRETKSRQAIPVDAELVKSIDEFVERTLTQARADNCAELMKQDGLPTHLSSTRDFITRIVLDAATEERSTLTQSGLDERMVRKALAKKALLLWKNMVTSGGHDG